MNNNETKDLWGNILSNNSQFERWWEMAQLSKQEVKIKISY